MSNFDYNRHTVVGELTINSNSGHGYVKVYGYMDGYKYISISTEESNRIFTPKGEVFAYNIVRDYSSLDRKLIALSVKPNDKDGDNRDDYVCDYYNGSVRSIGYQITTLPKVGVIGEYNYMQLQEHHLLGKDEPVFFQVKDKLYCIKDDKQRLIPYCTITDSMPIVRGKYDTYYLGGSLPMEQGVIDITNDQQLVAWFVKKIAKVCWHDIQSGNGKLAQDEAKKALEATSLDPNIVLHRLHRLEMLTESFVLTRDEVQSLIDAPWLQPTISKALLKFKEDFVNLILSENADEINGIRKEHKLEIQRETAQHDSAIAHLKESMERALQEHDQALTQYEDEIEIKKSELSKLVEDISDKESIIGRLTEQLSSINERKDAVVADFEVIRQVINLSSSANNQHSSIRIDTPITDVRLSDIRLPLYRGFNKNMEICLKAFGCTTNNISKLSELFIGYGCILLPNIESLMSVIYATGRCRYITSYVSVSWKSFSDLWENGLVQIIDSCKRNPQDIHYLVLRNINLSYTPNYLQPLLDAQMGFINTLPNSAEIYPANLKVLMTATEDEVIPLTKDCLRYVGCVSKKDFTPNTIVHKPKIEGLVGYLDTSILTNESLNPDEVSRANSIDDYINE
ncbi:MAG: hypothetical protein II986_06715 [Alistipes sp.]|nr:hypothetical protein [Alistipes sp.]